MRALSVDGTDTRLYTVRPQVRSLYRRIRPLRTTKTTAFSQGVSIAVAWIHRVAWPEEVVEEEEEEEGVADETSTKKRRAGHPRTSSKVCERPSSALRCHANAEAASARERPCSCRPVIQRQQAQIPAEHRDRPERREVGLARLSKAMQCLLQ